MDYRPHRYASACGRLELFARDYAGEGQPLLLLHGLTRNSADFEPLAAHLAGRYRLIVPDQRGRGRSGSDPDPASYRPDIYVQDMLALLDGLGIDKVGVIGTSMGGLMAMIMAAVSPARLDFAILNDIGPVLSAEGLTRIAGYVGPSAPFATLEQAARKCEEINAEAFPDFGPEDWLAFARRTCTETGSGEVVLAYDPAIATAFDGAPETQPDLWPLWAAMAGKPVLLLRGALSDLLSDETAQEMGERHQGHFTYVEVPRRGHAPLLDEPVALAAIEDFLKKHQP